MTTMHVVGWSLRNAYTFIVMLTYFEELLNHSGEYFDMV